MTARHLILLALLMCAQWSYGQTPTECWLCLTKEEALQAADSALGGQFSARSLAIAKVLYVTRTNESAQLREALTAKDAQTNAQAKAIENFQRIQDLMVKDSRKRKGRATRKTFLYVGIGALLGFVVGAR